MAKHKKRNRKQQKTNAHLLLLNHQAPSRHDWAGPEGSIGTYIAEESQKTLEAYRSQPNLVVEHANHEEDTARGGYAHRQLFELVQNSADAVAGSGGGHIWLRLTPTHLYCADKGQAIDSDGVRALMFSHLSSKRRTAEIGRFGLGFKSVLGVTDTPEFFSRSGSFRFDRAKAFELIRPIAQKAERYPVLRLPETFDPWPKMESDQILRELMGWAVNIVRLPLKPGAYEALGSQIRDFPSEFLLFVEHVSELVLQDDNQGDVRTFSLRREDNLFILDDGSGTTRWMLTKAKHQLSPDARSDSRSLDDASEVPISWAAPVDRLNEPGKFWTFFPTMTTSLLSGILNAPWKTNEDRQNLLPGTYNDELIDAAAAMVADELPQLSTEDDPARQLDALPRRWEAGDADHGNRLRTKLDLNLRSRALVPNQDGELRGLLEVSYPPRVLTVDGQSASDSLERWAAYEHRPSEWLHHSALSRNRLAKLDRLVTSSLPTATIAQWLGALVEDAKSQSHLAIQASVAAIQTAALIPEHIRESNNLGNIVVMADGGWTKPDPGSVFLDSGNTSSAINLIHPRLQADPKTLEALKTLGIKPASAETVFRELASDLLAPPYNRRGVADDDWDNFWRLARDVECLEAAAIIQEPKRNWNWRDLLRVRTVAGNWRSFFQALLPGPIVPADGSRDDYVSIDLQYHEADLPLLERLGAVDAPRAEYELSSAKNRQFINHCRTMFQHRAQSDIGHRPQDHLLRFEKPVTGGPLDVLESLSEEAKAIYTWDLLALDDTYKQWTMRHSTQDIYAPMDFE